MVQVRAVTDDIKQAGRNASALLKDPTGMAGVQSSRASCEDFPREVMCTIHSKVVVDHEKELQRGAVLVVRQVGVYFNCAA